MTPSLARGTVSLLDRDGRVRAMRTVARAAHDACIVLGLKGGLDMKLVRSPSSPFSALVAAVTAGAGGANGSPYTPGLVTAGDGVVSPDGTSAS